MAIFPKPLLILCVAASDLVAQSGERQNRMVELGGFFTDQLLWFGSNRYFTVIPVTAGALRSQDVSTSISLAGGATFVGAADPPPIVVSGRDPRTDEGVVELYVWDPDSRRYIAPPSGHTYREDGSDFVGVACSASAIIYLLDASKERIVFAPYQPGALLPTAWTVLVDRTVMPVLATADNFAMSAREVGATIELRLYDQYHPGSDRYTIAVSPSGVTITLEEGLRDRAAWIEADDLLVGRTWVRVGGPPNTKVSVIHMTGATPPPSLGAATTDAQGSAIVNLSTPLAAGEIYGAWSETLSKPAPPFDTPVFRNGAAEAIDSGSTIRPFDLGLALTAFVGSKYFRVPLWIEPKVPAQVVAPATYTGYLNVGSADDIVILPDGRRFLASPMTVSTEIHVWYQDEPGIVVVKMPIPDDRALANGVIYFQWVVIVGSDAKLSDIIGFPIRPERWVPPGSTLFGEMGSSLASESSSSSRSGSFREAFGRWLRSVGFHPSSDQEQAALDEMLER